MTSVRALADQAGQAIRATNHHTITPHGDMSVPDLYRVVGELGYLTRCLDQMLHQLSHTSVGGHRPTSSATTPAPTPSKPSRPRSSCSNTPPAKPAPQPMRWTPP